MCPKKLSHVHSIHARVHVSASLWWLRHNPVTKPLWSDYDTDTLCTVSDFMVAYRDGRSLTRHDIETGWKARDPFEDTCITYWLVHDTAIGQVTIPSNRADRPTLVQIHNLCRTDQHTRLLSPTVGLLIRRVAVKRPVSNLSYSTHPGFATQIKKPK